MRVSFVLFLTVVAAVIPMGAGAAGEDGPRVERMEICAAVREREPVGVAAAFPSDIARVYCFTRIAGARDTTSVEHVWYFKDKEMARVELPVKSASWRTWSSKKMAPDWKGAWRVEVVHADTAVIASKEFVLE